MSASLITAGIVNVLHVMTAGIHVYNGRWGLALAFASFALANVGLMISEVSSGK